jgi:small-conductance mechanosensitive channel
MPVFDDPPAPLLDGVMVNVLADAADQWSGDWWLQFGLKVGAAFIVAILVTLLGRRYTRRLRRRAKAAGEESGARKLRRTGTVVGLVVATVSVLAWFVFTVLFLSWLGVNLGPLLASAGIAGVALGFGAQTVVKDTLAGLFIALEGQFDIGDVVDLNTEGGLVSGSIEDLTLRITSVRQYDGTLSIVPNGSIQVTSNKTRGWGRAIVDIRLALDEDPEHVREVLDELFEELATKPPFDEGLRKEPQILGVTQTTDTALVIRVAAETLPTRRYEVERALREQISSRIAAKGIRVPPVATPTTVAPRAGATESAP